MAQAASNENPSRWEWTSSLPDRLRLAPRFDPVPLVADLATLETGEWTAHFVADNYDGDWSVLPLRAPKGAHHPILRITSVPGTENWEDTEFLAACPALRRVIDSLPAQVGAARLMRLGPGAEIKEHRDWDLSPDQGMVRLHIPIVTNPEVDFRVNGERVAMAPGELWYLRLADPHRVINAGPTPRVHLVIDCAMSAGLGELFRHAAAMV